jgi:NarL family two-component system response regulator LiaR
VLVVDDNVSVRLGLSVFLEVHEDMRMVGEAINGQEAVDLCEQLQPDVVLMDIHMPVMDGLTATRIIVKKHPHIYVIILTYSPGVTDQQGIEAGARTVIRKTVSIEALAEAIRAAAA